MAHYLVIPSTKRSSGLDWEYALMQVYEGADVDEVCRAAASELSSMYTFAVVEVTIWGIALMDKGAAKRLGAPKTNEDKLAEAMARLKAIEAPKSGAPTAEEIDAKLAEIDAEIEALKHQ